MSAGYVQVLFNYLTRAASPATDAPPQAHQWHLVHDATGKIVVRDSKHAVIATARWIDQRAEDRVHRTLGVPDDEQWSAIEHAIGGAVREARNFPLDPRTDDGAVERPAIRPRSKQLDADKSKQEDTKLGVGGTILAVLALAVIGFAIFVVMFWVVPWLEKHDLMPQGSAANGEACTTDSDCKSRDCHKQTCRGEDRKVRGDRCDRDADCKSKRCSSGTCD